MLISDWSSDVCSSDLNPQNSRFFTHSDTTVSNNGLDLSIHEEEMEEYRMLSNFSVSEVKRIFKVFYEATDGAESMQQSQFLKLEGIALNPIKLRVARCFGFDELAFEDESDSEVEVGGSSGKGISFSEFLIALSVFNVAGRRARKLDRK